MRGADGEATGSGLSRWSYWLRRRSLAYIVRRIGKLLGRYGITAEKAERRTLRLVSLLERYGCAPTLAVPGAVVARHPAFMRRLDAAGVELAFHGFDHVDFRSLSAEQSLGQVARSSAAFAGAGLSFHGFRFPYLSYSPDMRGYVPEGTFVYSSNRAVWWDVAAAPQDAVGGRVIFEHLSGFYGAAPAERSLVLPYAIGDLVEIPVSLPDDLQLLDGLDQDVEEVAETWTDVLDRSYERGSIFTVLMHPESFDDCAPALERLLVDARSRTPPVWITRLNDVAEWWHELASFSMEVDGSSFRPDCSDRATVLVRGLPEETVDGEPWADGYRIVASSRIPLPDGRHPFVGAAPDVPEEWVSTLRSLGYVVEQGVAAELCALRIESDDLSGAADESDLVALIESSSEPLARFWHWPDGARSALCVTGDLDALSLVDYARRIFTL